MSLSGSTLAVGQTSAVGSENGLLEVDVFERVMNKTATFGPGDESLSMVRWRIERDDFWAGSGVGSGDGGRARGTWTYMPERWGLRRDGGPGSKRFFLTSGWLSKFFGVPIDGYSALWGRDGVVIETYFRNRGTRPHTLAEHGELLSALQRLHANRVATTPNYPGLISAIGVSVFLVGVGYLLGCWL